MKKRIFVGIKDGRYVDRNEKVMLPMDSDYFDDTHSSKCPYCGAYNEFEPECEAGGDEVEIECENCEKYFKAYFGESWCVSEGEKLSDDKI